MRIINFNLFESYSSIEEYISYVINYLNKFDIIQSEIESLINSFYEKIKKSYNDGRQPFQIANDIAKELNLTSNGFGQYKKYGISNREVKYL